MARSTLQERTPTRSLRDSFKTECDTGIAVMAQGPMAPMAMADHDFPPLTDDAGDDLPRTFRREREARQREAREREAQERAAAPTLSSKPDTFADTYAGPAPQMKPSADMHPVFADMPFPASVRRFDVPFFHLVGFFLKAVIAAIPAIILLGVILWLLGAALQMTFPDLARMKILIGIGS